MNSRHRKTLGAVFEDPTRPNIPWSDIEALLVAVGCSVKEGSGSRVRFASGNHILTVHRPHPRKEAKQYLVRDVRDFFKAIGVTP